MTSMLSVCGCMANKWKEIFFISAVVILSFSEVHVFDSWLHLSRSENIAKTDLSGNIEKTDSSADVWWGLSATKGIDPLNCGVEDHFLIPLFESEMEQTEQKNSKIRVTLISEFFEGDGVTTALKANLRDNHHHARFVFLLGKSPARQLKNLQSIIDKHSNSRATVPYEVFYAPGGVTYRHFFSVAMLRPEPFLIYNANIAVDKLDKLLDACSTGLDDGLIVGSKQDVGSPTSQDCAYYQGLGSFDSFLTNRRNFDCDSLNTLKFPPNARKAENVVASQVPKTTKANICPLWSFTYQHVIRPKQKRIRIDSPRNSWRSSPKGSLEKICNVSLLKTQ